jgi:hypothetical protein
VPLGVIKSHSFLGFQWPLKPMPSLKRSGILGSLTPILDPQTLLFGDGAEKGLKPLRLYGLAVNACLHTVR